MNRLPMRFPKRSVDDDDEEDDENDTFEINKKCVIVKRRSLANDLDDDDDDTDNGSNNTTTTTSRFGTTFQGVGGHGGHVGQGHPQGHPQGQITRRRSIFKTLSAEESVMQLCQQTEPEPFSVCVPDNQADYLRMMSKCVKIGEGAYGEVFSSISKGEDVALKIMPIEGDLIVNDFEQKKFEEIFSEMAIAKALSDLVDGDANRTGNFCQVNKISCARGEYPGELLKEWDSYRTRKISENDRPDNFESDQLFAVFEFADGGCDVEHFKFSNHCQGLSVLQQVIFSLGAAELAMEFEHRDLHLGNVLVRHCRRADIIPVRLAGRDYSIRSEGVFATIIDFTISRIRKDGHSVFEDISTDTGFFTGKGDIQFDVYRDMRDLNGNKWDSYNPRTNILWAHYLCRCLLTHIKYAWFAVADNKYADKSSRFFKFQQAEEKLRRLDERIPLYDSCAQLACDDEVWA